MLLPTIPTPDVPHIDVKRDGDQSPTPIEHLSFGERCSAILTIALLEKDKVLIIDQPEEELDHQFITEDVVSSVKSIKATRQIIVATHNPNIPVLGDAELVMRLEKQLGQHSCQILSQGALEEERVLPHALALERGKDAFELRRRNYTMAL